MTNPEGQAKSLEAQQALVRLLNTPPENIIAMFDRLEIPWEKVKNVPGNEDYDCLIVRWKDLVEGEKRNQAAGPFIKKLVEEMRNKTNLEGTV